jgi:hypothetical protein
VALTTSETKGFHDARKPERFRSGFEGRHRCRNPDQTE